MNNIKWKKVNSASIDNISFKRTEWAPKLVEVGFINKENRFLVGMNNKEMGPLLVDIKKGLEIKISTIRKGKQKAEEIILKEKKNKLLSIKHIKELREFMKEIIEKM